MTRTSSPPQLAYVNHVFAVVDAETADALPRSPLLGELANFEHGTIAAAGGESWTGGYLMMRATYVEFFGPGHGGAGIGGTGSIGVALSGDRAGVLEDVRSRAEAQGMTLERGVRRRALAGDEIDWFAYAGAPDAPDGTAVTVDAWVMEYVAGYFAHPAARKRPMTGVADEVSRARYNDGSYQKAPIVDLSAVEFGIDRTAFTRRLRPLLLAAAFRLQDGPTGVEAVSDETSLTFRFASPPGLRSLQLRLATSVDAARTETIGRSTLVVGPGSVARWTFDA